MFFNHAIWKKKFLIRNEFAKTKYETVQFINLREAIIDLRKNELRSEMW